MSVKLVTKSMIDGGTVSGIGSYLVVADMALNGQIVLSMAFKDCDTSKTLSKTLSSVRDGYNAFYVEIESEPWMFVDITITKIFRVRTLNHFYVNGVGEIPA